MGKITFHCRDCGAEDFLPVVYGEEGYAIEHCPVCGSETIEKGYACTLCGRYAGDGSVCDDCADNLRNRLSELLHANFDEEEIAALNGIYAEEELG